jgi:hypothetical protein
MVVSGGKDRPNPAITCRRVERNPRPALIVSRAIAVDAGLRH